MRFQGPKGMVFAALLLGAIFLLVGSIVLALGVNTYRDGETTRSWPSTTRVTSFGVVIDSAMPSSGRRSLRLADTTRPSVR